MVKSFKFSFSVQTRRLITNLTGQQALHVNFKQIVLIYAFATTCPPSWILISQNGEFFARQMSAKTKADVE